MQQPYAPQPFSRDISINLISQSKTSLDQEIPLFESNKERNFYESISELYSIIIAINCLERSFTKDTLTKTSSELAYTNTVNRLLNQFSLILKDDQVRENFQDLNRFCDRMGIDVPLAKKRISIGIPATVESTHSSANQLQQGDQQHQQQQQQQQQQRQGSSEIDGVANSLSDVLVDHSLLSSTPDSRTRGGGNSKYSTRAVAEATGVFITTMDAVKLNYRTKDQLHPLLSDLMTSINKVLNNGDFKNRSKLIQWLIKLNNLGFNESLSDEESREFLFDLDSAYKGFYECLE